MATTHGYGDFPTHKILDAIVPAEYAALVEAAKDGLRIILSCGHIDLHEGGTTWNNLHAIFPDGKTTWTNIKTVSELHYDETPPI